jgi:RNA-directed DNA polymerase
MERSNQPTEPECCRREGQANAAKEGGGAERLVGGVHREIREPQAGVAPRLSNSASKPSDAGGQDVLSSEPETKSAATGEALAGLPGSKSVAREERTIRNQGDPVISRRTNYEGQAGRDARRQEGQTEGKPGVGSLHSSCGQGASPDHSEGGDRTTQPAQATSTVRTTGQSWPTFLRAIADKAQRDRDHRFGDLYRHLDQQTLRASFKLLRKEAACGVDGVTFQEYEQNLDANLDKLVERLEGKSYRARLVRRKYIPKDNGKLRPLGILVLEDKLVQCAVTQILLAIYEADFLPCSYAYRPERGPHDAVRQLTDELHWGKHNFVVEADIKGFFDHVRHELLLEMLARRIRDGALLRLIRKWLKAGILEEDGKVLHPELGTPQGGVVSPVLANVYLHYALDKWFQEEVQKENRGQSRLFRFADDFVACFEYRHEAAAFERALPQRLAQYGLEVAPDKTKRLRFGRNGGPYNGRFDFLGFEFRWEPDRKGRPTVKRRTARKKLQAAVQRMGSWLRSHRHLKLPKLMHKLAAKLRGHWNYYGVIGNSQSLSQYDYLTRGLVHKWLNRRSQKRSYTWGALHRLMERFQIPRPRIVEQARQRFNESCQTVWTLGQVLAINLYGDQYRMAGG